MKTYLQWSDNWGNCRGLCPRKFFRKDMDSCYPSIRARNNQTKQTKYNFKDLALAKRCVHDDCAIPGRAPPDREQNEYRTETKRSHGRGGKLFHLKRCANMSGVKRGSESNLSEGFQIDLLLTCHLWDSKLNNLEKRGVGEKSFKTIGIWATPQGT